MKRFGVWPQWPGVRRYDAQGLAAGNPANINQISPYSFVEADYYSVDLVSGKVAAFLDKVPAGTGIKAIDPTHAYSQATSARQCALPAATASLSGRLTANFNTAPYYVSTAAASAWKSASDGSGFESFVVWDRTSVTGVQYAWATYSTTETGAAWYGVGDSIGYAVYNGAVLSVNLSAAGWTTGPGYVNGSVGVADSPDSTLRRKTATVDSGNATAGFSSADGRAMTIGDISGGAGNTLNAKVAMYLFFNRVLSAPHRATVQAYISAKYGVT